MRRSQWMVLLPALALACSDGPLVPVSTDFSQLEVHLTIHPTEVRAGEPFTGTLALQNQEEAAVALPSSCSALALTRVERDGGRVPFTGNADGCLAVPSTHWVGPKETRVLSWHLQAKDYEGRPVEPGEYTLVVDFQTSALTDARMSFVVR